MSYYISHDGTEDTDTDKQQHKEIAKLHAQSALDYICDPVVPVNPCASLLNQSSQHAPEVVL